jgi:hypothetical protein
MSDFARVIELDGSWEFLTKIDFEFEQLLNDFLIQQSEKIYKQFPDNFVDFVSVYDHLVNHTSNLTQLAQDAEGRALWSKESRSVFKSWEKIDNEKDKEKFRIEPHVPISKLHAIAPRFSLDEIKNHLNAFFTPEQIEGFFKE